MQMVVSSSVSGLHLLSSPNSRRSTSRLQPSVSPTADSRLLAAGLGTTGATATADVAETNSGNTGNPDEGKSVDLMPLPPILAPLPPLLPPEREGQEHREADVDGPVMT